MQRYRRRTASVERDARRALWAERAARRRDLPDPAGLLLFATGPRSRLWERRPTDPDWLDVRVGTADTSSQVTIDDPERESHNRTTSWCAPDVPVAIPLMDAGVVGVAAPGETSRRLGAWITAQLATLHSPADLRLCVLCPTEASKNWGWVQWLPHCRGEEDQPYLAAVGNDEETTARRVAELNALLDARQEAIRNRNQVAAKGVFDHHVVVVMDGARRLRLVPGVVRLLKDGPAVGLRFVCLDQDERQLPDEASAVVSMHGAWLRVRRTTESTIEGVRPDLVPEPWFERLARAVSPIRDVSGDEETASIPTSSRLLTLLHLDPPLPERLADLWRRQGRTTTAVIGEGADGPFAIDVRRDGRTAWLPAPRVPASRSCCSRSSPRWRSATVPTR